MTLLLDEIVGLDAVGFGTINVFAFEILLLALCVKLSDTCVIGFSVMLSILLTEVAEVFFNSNESCLDSVRGE